MMDLFCVRSKVSAGHTNITSAAMNDRLAVPESIVPRAKGMGGSLSLQPGKWFLYGRRIAWGILGL